MAHELPYLAAVGLVVLAVAALSIRRRILFRVAVRNIGRRKTQVALAIAGLLVATSILSGSFVIGDSLNYAIRASAFRGLDVIDETIALSSTQGANPFFNESVYGGLAANRTAMPHVDGLGPRIVVRVSVLHEDSQLFEGQATLIGFDPVADPGVFVRSDGARTDGSELNFSEVFLSAPLAQDIEAGAGDVVTLFVPLPGGSLPVRYVAEDVLLDEGKGAWLNGRVVFAALPTVQFLLSAFGRINEIVVSNAGGVEEGVLATDDAISELDAVLGAGHPYLIHPIKRDLLDDADTSSSTLTQVFTLLGTFTIAAGLMLIVSIFTMLAEERKPEMGIQRAVGMRRSHLTELFTLEGFLYALASAALGAVAGLVVAGVIILVISRIFAGEGLTLVLRWEAGSLLLGFALGFLLTIATISLTSGRISKLNIVRAVRNIPEPTIRRASWGQVLAGAVLLAIGLIATLAGYQGRSAVLFSPGVALAALGAAQLAHRTIGTRAAFTVAGLFVVSWLIAPITWFAGTQPGIDLFIVTGIMLVLGGVLLVVFNNAILVSVLPRLAARRRHLQPVLRTAMAYPMNRPFRTGLTIAIFALVIFTIVVMATIQGLIGASVSAITHDASGGYDIFGLANPIEDFEALYANSTVAANITAHGALLFAPTRLTPPDGGDPVFYEVYGVDSAFVEQNEFTFYRKPDRFPTDRDVWREVLANPDVAVVDRTVQPVDFGPPAGDLRLDVGDVVSLRNASGGDRTVEIIGILDSIALRGFFLQADTVRSEFGSVAPSFFLFKVGSGEDPDAVAKDIERAFLPWQMQTIVLATIVAENLETTFAFFDLLEGYLAMGLLVGIAGLGIITLRNVTERRQEMGVLRAMGYRRGMILESLVLETSYVALLGIGLGVVLGILLSYRISVEFFVGEEAFLIPWGRIVLVTGVAYVMSVLATASPAIRAARFPPAEAIRYIE
ncbi:MAG: ABC transporter permease [Methanobacteriota archaeon]